MVEARLAEASTRVGGYGLRVGSARLPYPSRRKSEIQAVGSQCHVTRDKLSVGRAGCSALREK